MCTVHIFVDPDLKIYELFIPKPNSETRQCGEYLEDKLDILFTKQRHFDHNF